MISDAKPWDLAKDPGQRQTLNAVLYRAAESLRWLAVMLYPVMPTSAEQIYQQLGMDDDAGKIDPRQLRWGGAAAGNEIREVAPLFPRIDKTKTMEEIKGQKSEAGDQT